MRFRKAFLVFKKDFIEVSRNKEVLLPMIILPLIFALLLPAISIISPEDLNIPGSADEMLESLLASLPEDIRARLIELTIVDQYIYFMLVYLFAPFFLIIPIMCGSVIAADSFAGEKERDTLEALLATPLTDAELLLGKILVSFIPSMGVTLFGFVTYTLVVNLLTYPRFGIHIMPTGSWLVMIFVLAPLIALLGIGVTVVVSARVKGFREAQQLSGLLVVPVLLLLFGQVTGYLMLGSRVVFLLSLIVGIVDVTVFRLGLSLFQRENILSKAR